MYPSTPVGLSPSHSLFNSDKDYNKIFSCHEAAILRVLDANFDEFVRLFPNAAENRHLQACVGKYKQGMNYRALDEFLVRMKSNSDWCNQIVDTLKKSPKLGEACKVLDLDVEIPLKKASEKNALASKNNGLYEDVLYKNLSEITKQIASLGDEFILFLTCMPSVNMYGYIINIKASSNSDPAGAARTLLTDHIKIKGLWGEFFDALEQFPQLENILGLFDPHSFKKRKIPASERAESDVQEAERPSKSQKNKEEPKAEPKSPNDEDEPKATDCSICFNMMEDAMMHAIKDCGNSFCKPCIEESLSRRSICPLCNLRMKGENDLVPNIALRQSISEVLKASKAVERAAAPVFSPPKSVAPPLPKASPIPPPLKKAPAYNPRKFEIPEDAKQEDYSVSLARDRDYIIQKLAVLFDAVLNGMPTVSGSPEAINLRAYGLDPMAKAGRLLDIVQEYCLWQEFFKAWDKAGLDRVKPAWFK